MVLVLKRPLEEDNSHDGLLGADHQGDEEEVLQLREFRLVRISGLIICIVTTLSLEILLPTCERDWKESSLIII